MPLGLEKKDDKAVASPKKKQQKQLLMLGGIVLITVIVLVWGSSGNSPATQDKAVGGQTVTTQVGTEDVKAELSKKFVADDYNLDETFLESPAFKEAKSFGEHPVVAGQLGTSNPFVRK